MIKPTLIVMAKAPRVGFAKARLAQEAGAVEAWRIARAMLARTLRTTRDPRWRTIVRLAPDREAGRARMFGVMVAPQGKGDLGRRLSRALSGARRVAVIGTDCPDLRKRDIAGAFRALRHAPYAVGPAEDGGFYLLAARDGNAAAAAMAGVRWSTPHALADLCKNLDASCARLRTLSDVDTLTDWRKLQRAARRASSG